MKNNCKDCGTVQNITRKDNLLDLERKDINRKAIMRLIKLKKEYGRKFRFSSFNHWLFNKDSKIWVVVNGGLMKERYWKCKFCGYKNYFDC